ncbi:MAG: hypothetical protein Kow0069_05350 [Promethearchaeota archaeon]
MAEQPDRHELLERLMPKVLKKVDAGGSEKVVEEQFDVEKIVASLKRETSATAEEIKKVAAHTIRTLAAMDMPVLTAPMIREIACSVMLSLGFFRYRYEYTRIGFPMADLAEILLEPDHAKKIVDHVVFEYNAVREILDGFDRESGKP